MARDLRAVSMRVRERRTHSPAGMLPALSHVRHFRAPGGKLQLNTTGLIILGLWSSVDRLFFCGENIHLQIKYLHEF